jgi:hypothetical protein
VNVNRAAFNDRAPGDVLRRDRHCGDLRGQRDRADVRDRAQYAAFDSADDDVGCIAQARSALSYGVEHRLDVAGRLADHFENFRCRRLPLQRLLRFVEQAHVFDCDHRLVGEGLEEDKLAFGEGTGLDPKQGDGADGHPVAKQRHHNLTAPADLTGERPRAARRVRLGFEIEHLRHAPVTYRKRDQAFVFRGLRIAAAKRRHGIGLHAV